MPASTAIMLRRHRAGAAPCPAPSWRPAKTMGSDAGSTTLRITLQRPAPNDTAARISSGSASADARVGVHARWGRTRRARSPRPSTSPPIPSQRMSSGSSAILGIGKVAAITGAAPPPPPPRRSPPRRPTPMPAAPPIANPHDEPLEAGRHVQRRARPERAMSSPRRGRRSGERQEERRHASPWQACSASHPTTIATRARHPEQPVLGRRTRKRCVVHGSPPPAARPSSRPPSSSAASAWDRISPQIRSAGPHEGGIAQHGLGARPRQAGSPPCPAPAPGRRESTMHAVGS